MQPIKLKALRFETPAFRKLGDISIPLAERITLIAGHNGIGKSTILGSLSPDHILLGAVVAHALLSAMR